jgi:hypothetical protein
LNKCKCEFTKIPILGFNSGRYDLTFVINALANAKYQIGKDIISKSSGYMKLSYGKFVFLDAWHFCTPDTTLAKFAAMWNVRGIEKDAFPYDWFDSPEKLYHPELPPIDQWHNTMTGQDLDPKIYAQCQKKFQELRSK